MKIGLIIQGPIISGGLTGKTHGSGRTRVNSNRLVNFNCQDTINDNLAVATKLFDSVVVATWENEKVKLNDNSVKVLFLKDPTPQPPVSRRPVPGFPDFNKLNNARQFFSVWSGANYLENLGIEYVIKIRTDQLIDIKMLFQEFEFFISKIKKPYFVPFLYNNNRWMIPDFFIGGSMDNILQISVDMTNLEKQFHSNVHRDLFFKAYLNQGTNLNSLLIPNAFIDEDKESIILEQFVKHAFNRIWHPGSKELYSSIVWRGEPINRNFSDKIFAGKMFFDYNTKLVLNTKPSINWNQYLKYTTGSKSIVMFLVRFLTWRCQRMIRNIRSRISFLRDTLKLR